MLGAFVLKLSFTIPKLLPPSYLLRVPLTFLDAAASPSPSTSQGQDNDHAAAKSKRGSIKGTQQPAATATVTASEAVSRIAHWLVTDFGVLYAWATEVQCSKQPHPGDEVGAPNFLPNEFFSDLDKEVMSSGWGDMPYLGPYVIACQMHLCNGVFARIHASAFNQPDSFSDIWLPQVG